MRYLILILLVGCSTTYEQTEVEPKTAWEECEVWLTHDAETWSNCMLQEG